MKITIFVLFVSIIGLPALGQNLETTKLQQSIKEHPQQDTTRVNLLNTLAIDQSLQSDEIEKLSTEALTISRKTDYAIGEGYALLNLSTAKLKQGNRQQAVLFIQQADSIANKTGDQELIANVLLGMGNANMYGANNRQALAYKKKAEEIALKTGNKKLTSICQREIGVIYGSSFNDYPKAIEYTLKSVRSAEEAGCLSCLAKGWFNLGTSYSLVGDQDNALLYFKKAADANKQLGDKVLEVKLNNNIGGYYRLMGKYPEAIQFYNKSLAATKEPYAITMAESNLADVYTSTDSLALAYKYAFSSLATAKQIDDQESMAWIYSILSRLYLKKKMVDSAIYSSRQGLAIAKKTGTLNYMRDNAEALANAYAFKKDFENAYHYHLLYFNYHDSILNSEISKKIALLQYSSDLAKKQAQITALDQQKRVQQNFLISALIVLILIIIIAVVLLRANRLLQKQKLEIAHQRDQTNEALAELQQTQKQIIQSEKMASLGQLTAGIANEIRTL